MLWLGGIEFSGMELPETINMGGKQAIAVHTAIGGQRVVDAMGPDDDVIEWRGRLFGESAELRAFQLDLLRRSGREVELSFGIRIYRVVVNSFQATMEQPTIFGYAIACTIIEDLVAGDGGQESESIESMVAADIAMVETFAAAKFAIVAGINLVRNLVANPQAGTMLLREVGHVALGTARDALAGSIVTAAAEAAGANAILGAAAGVGGVEAGGDPEDMAGTLAGTIAAADDAHAMQMTEAHLTRLRANLEQAPA